METDLFTYNEETGEVEYQPVETSDAEDSVQTGEESSENGCDQVSPSGDDTGDLLSDSEGVSEDTSEISEADSVDLTGSNTSVLVVSDEAVAALAASSPASGSLSSSTIDYFDRLVSGLPSDYTYVAYRNDSDDSYAGTIIYGENADVSGNTIVFGKDAVEIDVSRSSGSSYSSYISYATSDATDAIVTITSSGTILYYTNALEGYPVLGGYREPVGASAFLVVGLLAAFASAVLTRLLGRKG